MTINAINEYLSSVGYTHYEDIDSLKGDVYGMIRDTDSSGERIRYESYNIYCNKGSYTIILVPKDNSEGVYLMTLDDDIYSKNLFYNARWITSDMISILGNILLRRMMIEGNVNEEN